VAEACPRCDQSRSRLHPCGMYSCEQCHTFFSGPLLLELLELAAALTDGGGGGAAPGERDTATRAQTHDGAVQTRTKRKRA
jgi:hypothetical protein